MRFKPLKAFEEFYRLKSAFPSPFGVMKFKPVPGDAFKCEAVIVSVPFRGNEI